MQCEKNVAFTSEHIKLSIAGSVAEIVIDRAERRNAVNLEMWRSIPGAVAHAAENPAIRSIILRGAGDKAFVAGADISEFDDVRCDAQTNHEFTRAVIAATYALRSCRLPVIAQIQGFCIGGGIVLACACDIRIADESATFAVPAAKLGLGYEYENYEALIRIVGYGAAAQMVLTAQPIDAQRALQIGLVQEVISTEKLSSRVREISNQMAALAPMTLAATKASALAAADPALRAQAASAIDACFDSDDFAEGRRAFKERRPPVFQGN